MQKIKKMTKNETYTRKPAVERLGIKSTNAFKRLEKKYSEFLLLGQQAHIRYSRYDEAAIDKFAQIRDALK